MKDPLPFINPQCSADALPHGRASAFYRYRRATDAMAVKLMKPPATVNVHSTSELRRESAARIITIPHFQPSCW